MKIFTRILSITLLMTFFTASSSAEDKLTAQQVQHEAFLNAYSSAWEEKDETKRLAIIKTFWSKDSIYLDPASHVVGIEQFNKMVSDVRKQYPTWIGTHGKMYSTGNYLTYAWEIRGADNNVLFSGYDTTKLDDNGKVIEMIGFF